MSKHITIQSSNGQYSVEINQPISSIPNLDDSIWLIDTKIRHLIPETKNSIYIDASEEFKNLETCIEILKQLHELGANKSSRIVAVGGGIIQDVATLVASIYMRGLKWIFVPTTKMSQLDSCIGGKSSINLSGIKNLIGNIYPPVKVVIDFQFDDSLPLEAKIAGYLEAIKISYARGESFFNSHLEIAGNYKNLSDIPQEELCLVVLEHKRYFIEVDENDLNERQLLNFGHTFGHALESSSNFGFHHGIAVGIGMLMALAYPLSAQDSKSILLGETIEVLLSHSGKKSIEALENIDPEVFYSSFCKDKKHSTGYHSLILTSELELKKVKIPLSDEHKNAVIDTFDTVRKRLLHELW